MPHSVSPVLTTFQSLTRIEQLQRDGCLVGNWDHVPGGWEGAYRRMVDQLSRRGIDCEGAPPMWAWTGPVTWGTAFGLLGDEVARGYGALTFSPPSGLVCYSDDDRWCDDLAEGAAPVECLGVEEIELGIVVQATVPRIELAWVSTTTPLPTRDSYRLDWGTPVQLASAQAMSSYS